ncbi:MAG: calcium/sodium antiporter [Spirochaetales bacterium]|nr:calcium/sodium antiporter [Spirochaetales bacterium]
MIELVLFVIGFVILIKGAGLLVDGSSSIAGYLKISRLVIGMTAVAFGTSLPELLVNVFASIGNNPGIAIGNIIGSNIANILLILGISSIIYPLVVTKGTVWREIPFCLLASLVFAVLSNDLLIDGDQQSLLTRIDGIVFLFFFVIFLYYMWSIARENDLIVSEVSIKTLPLHRSVIYMLAGLAGLVIGGKWIVDGAVFITGFFGIGQTFIGLSIIAVGTSLPELATSAIAAYKKNPDIAVGNVVGSNIFNIFFILGVSSIIKPLPMQQSNNIDTAVMIAATMILFLFMFTGKKSSIDRWEGFILTAAYAGYITYLILNQAGVW